MDVIKIEPGCDPLAAMTSDNSDVQEKKTLSEEGNLLDLDVTKIKTECVDHRYDIKSEIVFEESAVPIDFPMLKSEAEEEFCELNQVKKVKLEVTAEENEILAQSVAVSHNSGVATLSENISQDEDLHTDGKKYDCVICGRCFSDPARFKTHSLEHIDDKRFSCDVCGKCFSVVEDLNKHSHVHIREKPFCNVCGKGFSRMGSLNRHLRVHTGEKLFRCDVCGKFFCSSENVTRHLRLHTGEKPFSCEVCGKGFFDSDRLEMHSHLHTGEKPLNCHVCGKRFWYEGSMKCHVRDVCGKFTVETCSLKTDES
ncbi:gastrula zinc finger protein XlCGF17.1-like isoform X8 [Periplaneta americana]